MKMQEVRDKAKTLGINSFGMKKVDLIRAIQSREGNSPCFQTGLISCDQFNCCWRSECFPERTTKKNEVSPKESSYQKKVKAELEASKDKINWL